MSNTQIQPRRPRVPFVRPVHVSQHDGSGARWLLASNISEGGLFVRTPQPPAVGTRLRVDLEARGQSLRFAEAEVVWSRPVDVTRLSQALPGFGVRFLPLGEESGSLVRHLVDVGGTGRGQAKTVPFSSPEAFSRPSREPLHAPAAAMVDALLPTDRAPTGEWSTLPPPNPQTEPRVVVNMEDPLIALGDEEPLLDRGSVAANPAELPSEPLRRKRARGGDWIAGLVLVAAASVGGLCAWRGLAEPAPAASAPETVTVFTAQPPAAPASASTETASPEGPGELTAAVVEAAPPVKPTPAPAPAVPPAPVAAPARASVLSLPSGAAKSISLSATQGALRVEPVLLAGATIDRAFALSSPPRLVIDLNGPAPKGAPRVEGQSGVTAVRLGARSGGTRLVLDLTRAAGKVSRAGDAILVELR